MKEQGVDGPREKATLGTPQSSSPEKGAGKAESVDHTEVSHWSSSVHLPAYNDKLAEGSEDPSPEFFLTSSGL